MVKKELAQTPSKAAHKAKKTVQPQTAQRQTAPELPPELAAQIGEVPFEATIADELKPANTLEEPAVEPSIADDPKTEHAIDDILTKESDELLAVEDAKLHQEAAAEPPSGLGRFFATWWRHKWSRNLTLLMLLSSIAAILAVPSTRYTTLNTLGVRSSASLTVLDSATELPLKNVRVTLGNQHTLTDVHGVARLTHLQLGPQNLAVRRLAFAPYAKNITVGWGSNPLGKFPLKAVGRQYSIQVQDYLSAKPITDAEATSGDINALADKKGRITLTLNSGLDSLEVALTAHGYRDESFTLDTNTPANLTMPMVTKRKEVFLSKQSGKYDVYTSDIDGRNRQVLLAGTGRENSNLTLVTSPNADEAALVSTRDDMHDNDGYLLSALTIISLETGAPLTLDHAEQIQIIDWVGNRIVYEAVSAGASTANPNRYRLMSYDYKSNSRMQLATANQFNWVVGAGGQVYFAPSSTDPGAQLGLFRIKPDGSGKKRLFGQEVWSGFRTSYNQFYLQTPAGWYAYALGSNAPTSTPAAPSYTNRLYVDSPGNDLSLWVDNRDGKGTLLAFAPSDGKENMVQSQEGLSYPVRWLTARTIIYRVNSNQETADYAISLDGGAARKITDVTNTYGFAQAY